MILARPPVRGLEGHEGDGSPLCADHRQAAHVAGALSQSLVERHAVGLDPWHDDGPDAVGRPRGRGRARPRRPPRPRPHERWARRRVPAPRPPALRELPRRPFTALHEVDVDVDVPALSRSTSATARRSRTTRFHDSYDADAVERWWRVLRLTDDVFSSFRSRFTGKASPSQLFWHGFDLAHARYTGGRRPRSRRRPRTAEAYSHELISFGWWPGDDRLTPYPAFYAYTAPEPPGLRDHPLRPTAAAWHDTGNGSLAILAYDDVRATGAPALTCSSSSRAPTARVRRPRTGTSPVWQRLRRAIPGKTASPDGLPLPLRSTASRASPPAPARIAIADPPANAEAVLRQARALRRGGRRGRRLPRARPDAATRSRTCCSRTRCSTASRPRSRRSSQGSADLLPRARGRRAAAPPQPDLQLRGRRAPRPRPRRRRRSPTCRPTASSTSAARSRRATTSAADDPRRRRRRAVRPRPALRGRGRARARRPRRGLRGHVGPDPAERRGGARRRDRAAQPLRQPDHRRPRRGPQAAVPRRSPRAAWPPTSTPPPARASRRPTSPGTGRR